MMMMVMSEMFAYEHSMRGSTKILFNEDELLMKRFLHDKMKFLITIFLFLSRSRFI